VTDNPLSPAPETPSTDLTWANVLIVDDNIQNLELLEAYLEELGCEVRTARDGHEALALIAERLPDLMLLDIMMPRMSGYQVCERVKEDEKTRDLPVVMVTALGEVGDVERAVDAGADDFLTKPVHKVELLTRVRSMLRVRRLKLDLDQAMEQLKRSRDKS